MNKLRPLFLITFFWSSLTTGSMPDDQMKAKAVMNQVYESFIKILPYVYSEKLLTDGNDQKTRDDIIHSLTELQIAFKNAKHVRLLKIPGFRPSLETINTHIEATIDSMNMKNKTMATARLKAMTALCVSCHTGLSEKTAENAFGEAIVSAKRTQFESDYSYANYLFLVRRFKDAKTYYELAIKNSLKLVSRESGSGPKDDRVFNGDLFNSFRRLLVIETKINFNPKEAMAILSKYRNEKILTTFVRSDLDHWLKSLEDWKKIDVSKMGPITNLISEKLMPIESVREKVNSGDYDVTLLISSGLLSRYLNDHPQTELTPTILYWLAVAERRLSTTYFFSLADLYLKECIMQYPAAPMAKKCYKEYEDNVVAGFSGSSGTDIPAGEKRELDRLKSLLK